MSNKSKRYTVEFKKQIVELINNGKWYFKASCTDNGTKIDIIKANEDKYSISAMCRVLIIKEIEY